MQEIAIWNPKGGEGKTTLALNICGCLSSYGAKVLLIDRDPQKSALLISGISDSIGFDVISVRPQKISTDYDFVISDYPPRKEVVPTEKIIIAPIRPVMHNFVAFLGAGNSINKKQVIKPILNMFNPNRKSHPEIVNAAEEIKNAPRINNRSIYERTLNEGYTVFSEKILNLNYYGGDAARYEIQTALKIIGFDL